MLRKFVDSDTFIPTVNQVNFKGLGLGFLSILCSDNSIIIINFKLLLQNKTPF